MHGRWGQRLVAFIRRMPLQRKMWTAFFLTSLFPLLALGLFGLIQTDRALQQDTGARMEREVAVRASRMGAQLAAHIQTLDYLTHLPSLSLMMHARTPEEVALTRRQVERDFLALSSAARAYHQIRFLDQEGQEQVRVDYRAGTAVVTARALLQSKAGRPYFRQSIDLPAHEVYVSPVDLNQEHGKVEWPHTPVIRLAAPVFDHLGARAGIVVLNVDARTFLEDPIQQRPGAEFFIVKHDGSYVSHPDRSKLYGGAADLDTGQSVMQDYPELAERLLTNGGGITRSSNGRLVSFVRLTPTAASPYFLVLVLIEEAGVMVGLANPMLWGVVGLILVTGLGSRWAGMRLARHIVEPIEALREGVARLRRGDLASRVETGSEDETAALAADVNHMAADLQSMYTNLEQKVEERTRTLAEMHRKLQESDRHKSQFLANISHELRTPLTAVIGFAEELEDGSAGALGPRQQRYAQHVLTSARHLLQIINDLLDLSKVEAGRMTIHPVDIPLAGVVEEAVAIIAGLARTRGLQLTVSVPRKMVVLADRERLKQVLLNLLSNACKFTPAGGEVRVEAGIVDGQAMISVVDSGIGIAPEDQGRIFREFEQVDGSLVRRTEGTGLGLPLSRKLVELMNGAMGVRSQLGAGSCFWFTLPGRGERDEASPGSG